MKSKFEIVFRWFTLVIIVVFLAGCNLQRFLIDHNEKYNPTYPTAFRCEAKKGLLFGADIPRIPSYDNPKYYISNTDMDFFVDFYYPENANNIIPMIDYSVEITSHTPIINSRENSVDFGIEKLHKSGKGQGFWYDDTNHGLFTGMLKEKTRLEHIKPEGESGESGYDVWFVGYENFIDDSVDNPHVFLCFYTGKFNLATVKATGVKGFAEFCSLPEYGYFVCNPR